MGVFLALGYVNMPSQASIWSIGLATPGVETAQTFDHTFSELGRTRKLSLS